MADQVSNLGAVSQAVPGMSSDNTLASERLSKYGEQYTLPIGLPRQALAMQGSYFVAHNNTIDVATTLAGHPAPVLVDADATLTKPLLVARHGGAATSRKWAYLDFIDIEVITAGANGTSSHWTAQMDSGADRYSSGTVETFTSYNANMQSTATADLSWRGGPFVASAETANVRRIGHGTFKNSIELAHDRYLFRFGADPGALHQAVNTAIQRYVVNLPPVVLGPSDSFLLALWQVAQDTAGVYKIRMGWWEI